MCVFVARPATVILEDDQVEMMNIQYMWQTTTVF